MELLTYNYEYHLRIWDFRSNAEGNDWEYLPRLVCGEDGIYSIYLYTKYAHINQHQIQSDDLGRASDPPSYTYNMMLACSQGCSLYEAHYIIYNMMITCSQGAVYMKLTT